MHLDFIRGVLQTLNKLHWKLNANEIPLTSYGNDILMFNKINGTIYFDVKKQEYLYSEFDKK